MPLTNPAASAFRCRACSRSIWTAFAALSPPSTLSPSPFSGSSLRYSSHISQHQQPSIEEKTPSQEKPPSDSVTFTPWYLQSSNSETPLDESHPRADRQRIPDLPDEPPPILHGLLEHVSKNLGLDDLSLYDLRALDPPPALGANLIMIIGTARSEQHLHVSADRFCRWLRSNHGLKPYGDGLLGRNELKLKIRRRNRRLKIMGAQNNNAAGSPADGFRTGWVCVNAGAVDPSPDAAAPELPEGFIGFTSGSHKVNIVVQMFTEDKRAEFNLDGLWSETLTVAGAKESRRQEKINHLRDGISGAEGLPPPITRSHFASRLTGDALDAAHQSRSIHSSARRQTLAVEVPKRTRLTPLTFTAAYGTWNHSEARHGASDNGIAHGYLSAKVERSNANNPFSNTKLSEVRAAVETPNFDREQLRSALEELRSRTHDGFNMHGKSFSAQSLLDVSTTASFLKQEARNSGDLHALHWELLLETFCSQMDQEPNVYSETDLMALLESMIASGVSVRQEVFERALGALLKRPSGSEGLKPASFQSFERAFTILEWMEACGHNPASAHIWSSLHNAIAYPSSDPQTHQKVLRTQQHLLRWMDVAGIVLESDRSRGDALDCFFTTKNLKGAWTFWNGLARHDQRRSEELYTLFLNHILELRNQIRAAEALRICFAEMRHEQPPIRMTPSLATAFQGCLLLVEPDVQRLVQDQRTSHGEWAVMWRQCNAFLKSAEP